MGHKRDKSSGASRTIRLLYWLTLTVLVFTGLSQMPIFKRYGIASMPGLGWSGDYRFTHYLHYLGAVFLIGLMAYLLMEFVSIKRRQVRLTRAGLTQIVLLAAIVTTGVFRVLKNLPEVLFSPFFTMVIDLSHLGFVMVYFASALVWVMTGRKWVRADTE